MRRGDAGDDGRDRPREQRDEAREKLRSSYDDLVADLKRASGGTGSGGGGSPELPGPRPVDHSGRGPSGPGPSPGGDRPALPPPDGPAAGADELERGTSLDGW